MSKLSELFKWKKQVNIEDNNGKILTTIYMRIVGDADYREARTEALGRSRNLRAELRNSKSKDYKANFSSLNSVTKEEMLVAIVMSEIPDYRDECLLTVVEEKIPDLSDNPSLEEQEEHQEIIDRVETSREEPDKNILKFIENRSEERKVELSKKKVSDLLDTYITAVINLRCNEEFAVVFREYITYKGTYSDDKYKNLACDSFEDFTSSVPYLKNRLMAEYDDLMINGERLKN